MKRFSRALVTGIHQDADGALTWGRAEEPAIASAVYGFCCRSGLLGSLNADSLVLKQFSAGASDDGAAQSRPGATVLLVLPRGAVPDDHLVRQIAGVLDLSWVHAELRPFYSRMGRPSVDPALMIRMHGGEASPSISKALESVRHRRRVGHRAGSAAGHVGARPAAGVKRE